MKKKKIHRDRVVKVYLTIEEYNLFEANFKATIFRVLADYHRALLFGKPVKLKYRNRSLDDFVTVAGQLKGHLDAIDRNWARAIRELRERPSCAEGVGVLETLLSREPTLLQTLQEIKSTLLKIYENESQNKDVQGHE